MKPALHFLASILIGILCGIFLHYVLYRISLSGEPFIYFSF
jgi:hypothetical protein